MEASTRRKVEKKVAFEKKDNVLQRDKTFYYVLSKNYFANDEGFK